VILQNFGGKKGYQRWFIINILTKARSSSLSRFFRYFDLGLIIGIKKCGGHSPPLGRNTVA